MIRVLALAAIYVTAGADCGGAVSCFSGLSGAHDEEESLLLLQRRARSFQQSNESNRSEVPIAGGTLANHSWDAHRLVTLATQSVEAVAAMAGEAAVGDFPSSRRSAAAVMLGIWVTGFAMVLSCMMYSVLAPPSATATDLAKDRQDVTMPARKANPDILETAMTVNIFSCLSFTWLDSFLAAPGPQLEPLVPLHSWQMVKAYGELPRVKAASLWNMLRRAVGIPFTLLSIAWFVAFLELVAMVLILDALLSIYERPDTSPLHVTSAVLLLLFVLPLIYRYFSGVLSMVDGLQVALICSELTSMLYQKAMRLPIGSTYHGHKADEELTGWQVAQALVEGTVQEWPLMIRSLALFTAAPVMASILVLLLVLHLQLLGLVGFLLLIPGTLLAFLLVKCAISQRRSYQHWQSERLRCQKALKDGSAKTEIRENIMDARRSELVANQWYSVLMALLAGSLHAIVWLVVVASLYLATLKENLSARNWWVMLQMVTSLQTCGAWIFTGLRRAWQLPKSLRRVECFLEQPEMPRDVVRRPLSTVPEVARISGSFSFEEGGPTVLRDLDLSLAPGRCVALCGPAGSGKSALMLALLGELFPCGLACVSSTSKRCFLRTTADAILLELNDLLDVELLLWDGAGQVLDPALLQRVVSLAQQRGAALLVALDDTNGVEVFDDVVKLRQGHVVNNRDVQAKEPATRGRPEATRRTPLKMLGDALQLAMEETGPVADPAVLASAHQKCQGAEEEGSLGSLALAYLATAGAGNMVLVVFLVFAQRSFQLLQFLFLATWADAVALDPRHVDHKSFALSIVVSVGLNAALLTLSEWATSRATMTAGLHMQERHLCAGSDLGEVDSVLSGWLACARSLLGIVLQQSYILLIAPQWLAVTLLLPAYLCIACFAWIYVAAAVPLALKGEDCFRHARLILNESLDPDPVQVRANHLQRSLVQRFTAQMRSMANFHMLLSAGCKSWLSFRVTFCVAFAATSCVLQVLLCDHHIGVGTLALVISLLFALTNDIDFACDSCVQGCRALATLQRLGAFVRVERADGEPMEVSKDSLQAM